MENLAESVKTLQAENELLKEEKALLELKIKWFEDQHRLHLNKMYGKSSEKSEKLDNGQISLFNEAESEAKPEAPEPTIEEIKPYKRRKKQGHREEMLKDLPVETVEYHLSEKEQKCDCGGNLHVILHCLNNSEFIL